MSKIRLVALFSLFFCLIGVPLGFSGWREGDRVEFDAANKAYRDGNFQQAIDLYAGLSEKYPEEGTLYYNLGNAYYRKGDLGDAILAYERALVYHPRHRDIRENLAYVRGLLEYKVEDTRNWYLQFAEKCLQFTSEKELFALLLLASFFFLITWAYVLFFRRGLPWGPFRKTMLIIAALCAVLLIAKEVQMRVVRGAIVLSNEAEVRYGPSDSDQVAFRLGEGLKVYVVDQRENWNRVLVSNGESGWVRNDQIVEI